METHRLFDSSILLVVYGYARGTWMVLFYPESFRTCSLYDDYHASQLIPAQRECVKTLMEAKNTFLFQDRLYALLINQTPPVLRCFMHERREWTTIQTFPIDIPYVFLAHTFVCWKHYFLILGMDHHNWRCDLLDKGRLTSIAVSPLPVRCGSSIVTEETVYLLGISYFSGTDLIPGSLQMYHPEKDKWEIGPSIPLETDANEEEGDCTAYGSVLIGKTKIYHLREVCWQVYDIPARTWTRLEIQFSPLRLFLQEASSYQVRIVVDAVPRIHLFTTDGHRFLYYPAGDTWKEVRGWRDPSDVDYDFRYRFPGAMQAFSFPVTGWFQGSRPTQFENNASVHYNRLEAIKRCLETPVPEGYVYNPETCRVVKKYVGQRSHRLNPRYVQLCKRGYEESPLGHMEKRRKAIRVVKKKKRYESSPT